MLHQAYSSIFFFNIMNRLFLCLHCESEESFGVKLHLHVLLPLVVVERSEKLHWRGHCATVANVVKETELLVANAVKDTKKPINHTIK